jgi:hypothetical protein
MRYEVVCYIILHKSEDTRKEPLAYEPNRAACREAQGTSNKQTREANGIHDSRQISLL